MPHIFESATTKEIDAIETDMHKCFETNASIDPKKIKRLLELREQRMLELIQTREQRLSVMQGHTRTLTSKLTGLKSKGNAEIIEKIHSETEKYDLAAVHWVNAETCIWEESKASAIAAGILILANEIC